MSEAYSFEYRVLRCLYSFLTEVYSSADFCERLAYRPREALERHYLDGSLSGESLPIHRESISVVIDHVHLFGHSPQLVPVAPPLALRLVLYGVKPMALLHGPENTMICTRRWANNHGLQAILSPYQYFPVPDHNKGGYVNLAREIPSGYTGMSTHRALLVSKNESSLITGWLCLLFGWHGFLGRLLGYPDCCAKAFEDRWSKAICDYNGDPVWSTLAYSNSPPYDWKLNIFARYFGFQLIEHFPCNLNCQASLQTGKLYFDILSTCEPDYAEKLRNFLTYPILLTQNCGVFVFPKGYVSYKGEYCTIRYNNQSVIMTSQDTKLASSICQSNHIRFTVDQRQLNMAQKGCTGYFLWFKDESFHEVSTIECKDL